MKFSPIIRAKRIPAETAAALGLTEIKGENRLEVRNESGKPPEIVLLGSVGKSWWDDSGISEQEVRDAINTIPKGTKFNIRINSEGGSVKEGLGIYNALKSRSEDSTCYVDGYALSIASVIPLGAGKVVSPSSAIWMSHKAWTYSQGNSDDMQREVDCLKEHDKMLAEIYSKETGKSVEEWEKLMAAETWVRGSKAVEFGLADEGDEDSDNTQASHPPIHSAYLSRCKNAGPEILNAISARTALALKTISAHPSGAVHTNKQNLQDQMKEKALAQLKEWGVNVPDNSTDEQIFALLTAGKPGKAAAQADNKTETASTDVAALTKSIEAQSKLIEAQNKRFEEMEKRAKAEKIANFKTRFDGFVAEAKITADEATEMQSTAEALLDAGQEAKAEKLVSTIANRAPAVFGAGSLGHVQILSENPLEKIFAEKDPAKRHATMQADWDGIIADAFARDDRGDKCRVVSPQFKNNGRVQNGNTYSATLVTAFLGDGATTILQKKLASLAAFSKNWSTDRYKPLATGQLKKVTVGSTTQTNATNFESGDSTVTNVQCTVAQYTQSFQVSNADVNSGLRMQDLVKINSSAFGNKLMQVATAPITEANFANYNSGSYIAAPAAFGWSDMALIWGALKNANERQAVLDGEYIGMLNNQPTFFQNTGIGGSAAMNFGWDGISLNTEWTGAGTGVRGFACDPQALGTVIGLPLTPTAVGSNIPGGTLSEATFQVPGLNITVALYVWFSLSSRTLWSSYDIILGAAALDTTAGVIIKAA